MCVADLDGELFNHTKRYTNRPLDKDEPLTMAWSPDGERITFALSDYEYTRGVSRRQVYTMVMDGRDLRLLDRMVELLDRSVRPVVGPARWERVAVIP